jgi:glycosyltransferase involved in cell wall biosynthesis
MKRLLIVSYAFPPMSIAGSFRPMRFVKHLRTFGWEAVVITVEGRDDIPTDPTLLSHIPNDIEVFKTKALGPKTLRIMSGATAPSKLRLDERTGTRENHRIRREVLNVFNNAISIPDPLIYWVPSVVWLGRRLHAERRFDAIFTTSPPHSVHFAGLALSRYLGIPWVSDFRDPWVDNVYFEELKGGIRRSMEGWLERLVLEKSARVIANTELNRLRLLSRYGSSLPDKKAVTITNGFDREFIDSIPPEKFDKFTICHSGALYSVLDTHFIFEAFAQWIRHLEGSGGLNVPVQLVFVGGGGDGLVPIVERLSIKDYVRFIPRVSHETAVSYSKGSHLLLVNIGLKNNEKARGWLPLKVYDYLGCNKPILGILPDDGAAAELIHKGSLGYVVSKPDYEAVAGILENRFLAYRNGERDVLESTNLWEIDRYEIGSLTRDLATVLNEVSSRS